MTSARKEIPLKLEGLHLRDVFNSRGEAEIVEKRLDAKGYSTVIRTYSHKTHFCAKPLVDHTGRPVNPSGKKLYALYGEAWK